MITLSDTSTAASASVPVPRRTSQRPSSTAHVPSAARGTSTRSGRFRRGSSRCKARISARTAGSMSFRVSGRTVAGPVHP